MFACGLKQPLDELREKLQNDLQRLQHSRSDSDAVSDDCIAVFAYLDDTIVGVPAALAERALQLAVATFAASGHTGHPGKSACWSHSVDPDSLPAVCQRIWKQHGLKVGGIPVFNAANEPVLAHEMLEKRLQKIESEADFLSSILF